MYVLLIDYEYYDPNYMYQAQYYQTRPPLGYQPRPIYPGNAVYYINKYGYYAPILGQEFRPPYPNAPMMPYPMQQQIPPPQHIVSSPPTTNWSDEPSDLQPEDPQQKDE